MSHFEHGEIPREYSAYIGRKTFFLTACLVTTLALLVAGVSLGAVSIPMAEVVRILLGVGEPSRFEAIIWHIRLPHALAAVAAGAGLAAAGTAMQSILRNPLGSPFTLGISQAGAFGAAFAVMVLGSGVMQSTSVGAVTISDPMLTTACAFVFCLAASLVIIAVARMRGATPEVMVLCGVALGALFTAGSMFLQYFADDVQLAAMVFWTFGDVGRAGWREVGILFAVVVPSIIYFSLNRWRYNAIDAGDETARGLGVRVSRVRLAGMLVASLLTATIVSFLGVIGFVGLVCPHIVRRIIGDDHRFLLPASCLVGAALLLASDMAARLVLAPHVLPVSILTAMLGAPAFLSMLITGVRR
ncbi:ABC-type transporter, integral membrane subunit [Alkalidesulfovibrio alkalitolerans DSM 16529]|uniref:ABC-type transporter, integral membrane subunit n=1 Tax=Alkalidesulfovibrio alkalitolerans DSM 16529 TaxID=1121439 RepID=S7UFP0_9BACT|nr:iron ABC transporter permease [Alkalidesulfovibrio alkalitolerans]EPR31048.1 ABC-type transporter, integral membrane subunit [Alkalidesulfovibrio alkalitolerans DSM 16529]